MQILTKIPMIADPFTNFNTRVRATTATLDLYMLHLQAYDQSFQFGVSRTVLARSIHMLIIVLDERRRTYGWRRARCHAANELECATYLAGVSPSGSSHCPPIPYVLPIRRHPRTCYVLHRSIFCHQRRRPFACPVMQHIAATPLIASEHMRSAPDIAKSQPRGHIHAVVFTTTDCEPEGNTKDMRKDSRAVSITIHALGIALSTAVHCTLVWAMLRSTREACLTESHMPLPWVRVAPSRQLSVHCT
ncbi:hypothetical protein PLICRDRAFT_45933 [Plicaturopsis crispa FD-325 SS-3]|uniref:Uncharacterized protein n=1 Tax=Plicaturopsis crispa FD-325 SS-3 TaxID=944288 RepID=A0A0C9SRC9_PLICR|nr:hypothetical protein PLICRDRAFT_45933 [Plicaturopsis crispa FD-325 SS-3]